jgi:hypothetical protein
VWRRDPIGGQSAAVNALSVATFFTLLDQGRLVDDPSSQQIKGHLVAQRAHCRSFFEESLQANGRFGSGDSLHSKIGIYSTFYHEGALINRSSIGKKYVAVILTESGAGLGYRLLWGLIPRLDDLIRTNP